MAKRVSGVVGFWSDDHDCVEAAHKMRQAGYKHFDAITPFPVHGMEEAVGWCVNCHRESDPKGPLNCSSCHH